MPLLIRNGPRAHNFGLVRVCVHTPNGLDFFWLPNFLPFITFYKFAQK
jgi:hypothetical protein